jgi:hypothetical protein
VGGKLKIVILGYIVRGPLGGLVWHHLQYVLGLHLLGHEVLFLEDGEDYESCYDPLKNIMTSDPSYGVRFIKNIFNKTNLKDKWAYYDAHTHNWLGKTKLEVEHFCKSADIVLNISGVNPVRDWWINIPIRVFIDTDPAFVQIRHIKNKEAKQLTQAHNVFFSFGENIGQPNCLIPQDGFKWQPTRQPIVLNIWPIINGSATAPWSTVMQWDSYKSEQYEDQIFGMKSMSFEQFFDLPASTEGVLQLAIGSSTAPKHKLKKRGWQIQNSLKVTKTPWTYQSFIQKSKGEWSIAKHGYVVSNSGWFSERSAAYLASSRPVVVQDTGFSSVLPVGEGLFAFKTKDECVEMLKQVSMDYDFHCKKARDLAHDFFNSDKVLNDFLNKIT